MVIQCQTGYVRPEAMTNCGINDQLRPIKTNQDYQNHVNNSQINFTISE